MWVVAKADGILALQKGLTPALMFQFVLNGTRYGQIKNYYKKVINYYKLESLIS